MNVNKTFPKLSERLCIYFSDSFFAPNFIIFVRSTSLIFITYFYHLSFFLKCMCIYNDFECFSLIKNYFYASLCHSFVLLISFILHVTMLPKVNLCLLNFFMNEIIKNKFGLLFAICSLNSIFIKHTNYFELFASISFNKY